MRRRPFDTIFYSLPTGTRAELAGLGLSFIALSVVIAVLSGL